MTDSELEQLNVLGEPLELCSRNPLTGFFRTGCCETSDDDVGSHTVCVVMTDEFLAYSKYVGNDLSTPKPEYNFAGLSEGDQWCLCALRYLQAYDEGIAPRVRLQATNIKALDYVPIEFLKKRAIDLN